jgi:HPt (histidine-containing phosphotransfer) domain-containing protein
VVPKKLRVVDFAQARATMDHDRALFEELAQMCLVDVPAQLALAVQGEAANDHHAVREAAHALKGMVSIFGAERTEHAAAELERLAKTGPLPDGALVGLQAAVTAFLDELRVYRWEAGDAAQVPALAAHPTGDTGQRLTVT